MKNKGLHHITIISGDAQTNADFYINQLGLRLVLKSVNQDDPKTYHLFYANGAGTPGSGITFFPWPMAVKGEAGTGQAIRIAFSVPPGSQDYWINRLSEKEINFKGPFERFGYDHLRFDDPDGLTLELVFDEKAESIPGWAGGTVPAEHSIRGFWSTTLLLTETDETAEILTQILGFKEDQTDGNKQLFTADSNIGRHLIIKKAEVPEVTQNGRGIVHHVAFRANDLEEQKQMRTKVINAGLSPSDVIDRHVFKSVYFRTPGGVLFEIATDDPGYKSVAENDDEMGRKLFLPPWLETRRTEIESHLPPIDY